MGIIVHVLRPVGRGDCSNNGVTARARALCIVNVPGPFYPSDECPAARLESNSYGTAKVVPADEASQSLGCGMFGGNFVSSSDGRWGDAVAAIIGVRMTAVPVHDRFE